MTLYPGQVLNNRYRIVKLPGWRAAYTAVASATAPARLHPDRLLHYLGAFPLLFEGDQPIAALWPLLHT
jgi:hypothetical protein